MTRKLTGLAAGQYDTDAVNMKQWTNTMLATTGDFKDSSYTTTYGSDGTPRTVTKLLNQSLKITGGVDNTLYYQSDFAAQPNIGLSSVIIQLHFASIKHFAVWKRFI